MTGKLNQSNEPHPLGKLRKSYTPRTAPGKVMLGMAIFCGVMCRERNSEIYWVTDTGVNPVD